MIAIKIIAIAALFAGVTVEAVPSREVCIEESASYLANVVIDAPVKTLVAKSREFYPDVLVLIEDEVPNNEYNDALIKIGQQVGCDEIIGHFRRIPQEVPCYETQDLEQDSMSMIDIIKSGAKAKEAVEAYLACVAAIDE